MVALPEEKNGNPLYMMDDSFWGSMLKFCRTAFCVHLLSGEQYAGASMNYLTLRHLPTITLLYLLRPCMSHLRFFFLFSGNGMFRALQLESFCMRLRLRYCSFFPFCFSLHFFALPNYSTDAVLHSSSALLART